MTRKRTRRKSERRAAVAVEFAFVAPVFVVLLVGMQQAASLYDTQGQLKTAAREGARLASMDRDGILMAGETTNQRMESDIRAYLNANGLPGDDVTVHIAQVDANNDGDVDMGGASDPYVDFDVDDSDNNLKNFQVRVELDYEDLGGTSMPGMSEFKFGATVVFRNARAALVQ